MIFPHKSPCRYFITL